MVEFVVTVLALKLAEGTGGLEFDGGGGALRAAARRFSGLIVASVLIVAFNYATILLISQLFVK